MHRVICLLLFIFCYLPSINPHTILPSSQDIIAHVQDGSKGLDRDSAVRSRALQYPRAPILISSSSFSNERRADVDPNTSLEPNTSDESASQPAQVEPDNAIDAETDHLFPMENQGNLIQHDNSQNLALLDGEGDFRVPFNLPSLDGSGEINYGSDPIQMLNQFVHKLWGSSFDPMKQPKPECKNRAIPYGTEDTQSRLVQMFPFCCERAAKFSQNSGFQGDQEQRRLSFMERQVGCDAWSRRADCNPDTIDCCFCKRETGRTAFYCRKYYTEDGKPGADADPDSTSNTPKREVIPIMNTMRNIAAAAARTGRLYFRQDENGVGSSDAVIAMSLGDDSMYRPGIKAPYTCTDDFLRYEGLTPRVRPKRKPSVPKPRKGEVEEPPEYEHYCEDDEGCDDDDDEYLDLITPAGWDTDPRHRRPNQ